MLSDVVRQSNLFFVISLRRDSSLHKDGLLGGVDELLDDRELIRLVEERLASRWPNSRWRGRPAMAADRVLRSFVLKHIKGWSFRELAKEIASSLIYRRFTRFDEDQIPDPSTFCRVFALLDEAVTKAIHRRVLQIAGTKGVDLSKKLRTDTTVVETNIHYPTDSSLLDDSMRVVTRLMLSIRKKHPRLVGRVVDHRRAVGRRVGAIRYASRIRDKKRGEAKRRKAYERLLRIARRRLHQARQLLKRLRAARRVRDVRHQQTKLEHYVALMAQVVEQARARVIDGNTKVKGKVLSIFEPHTQVVRKGKLRKPNEFGRLIRLDGVEHGLIGGYDILKGKLADSAAWEPALTNHIEIFRRAPGLATGDAGFHSKRNEDLAKALGVRHVVIRKPGRLSEDRRNLQKKRWFRNGMKWRTGIEAQIGILKHPLGMDRAVYKRETGFHRHVAGCVIANNLVALARTLTRRELAHAS
jgi:IS5 family transposase